MGALLRGAWRDGVFLSENRKAQAKHTRGGSKILEGGSMIFVVLEDDGRPIGTYRVSEGRTTTIQHDDEMITITRERA